VSNKITVSKKNFSRRTVSRRKSYTKLFDGKLSLYMTSSHNIFLLSCEKKIHISFSREELSHEENCIRVISCENLPRKNSIVYFFLPRKTYQTSNFFDNFFLMKNSCGELSREEISRGELYWEGLFRKITLCFFFLAKKIFLCRNFL
jgi:hypothetical protein